MKIEYTKQGDYYIPNIVALENITNFNLGKYGRMRLKFLKEHKKEEFTILFINNELQKHLIDVDETATNRFNLLTKQFAEKENITEELKANNQLEWVSSMNNIKNRVEEIIFEELIYV